MAKERVKAKKAQAGASRQERLQQERRRTRLRRVVLGVVLLAALAGTGYCVRESRRFTAAIVTATYRPAMHVPGPLNYEESPPIGGPHNVVWQSCGIYTAPIHNEHGVHSLEHGAVWITYRPDVAPADLARLQRLASDDYILLSPYPGLPAPVVVTAWNTQLRLTGADDTRLPQFIRRFKNNPSTTPEFGASCLGGNSGTADKDTLSSGSGPMIR
jgi:hypothetical protein